MAPPNGADTLSPVKSLMLTGQYGAGKSAVAAEISHLLGDRGIRTAAIDLDWLAWAGPDLDADTLLQLQAANLAALVRGFRSAGVDRFVIAGTVLTTVHLNLVKQGVKESPLTVVRLNVTDAEAMARIRRRDVGRELAELLDDASEIAGAVSAADLHDFEVDNSGDRSIGDVAEEVLNRAGW